MKYSSYDLYVIVTSAFMCAPSCDDTIYSSKEEAEADMKERSKHFQSLTFTVMTLDDYFDELRGQCDCEY